RVSSGPVSAVDGAGEPVSMTGAAEAASMAGVTGCMASGAGASCALCDAEVLLAAAACPAEAWEEWGEDWLCEAGAAMGEVVEEGCAEPLGVASVATNAPDFREAFSEVVDDFSNTLADG